MVLVIVKPSLVRFLSDEVMVVASAQSQPVSDSPPALTFCPYNHSK